MSKTVWMVLAYSLQSGYSPLKENLTEEEALKLAQKENAKYSELSGKEIAHPYIAKPMN